MYEEHWQDEYGAEFFFDDLYGEPSSGDYAPDPLVEEEFPLEPYEPPELPEEAWEPSEINADPSLGSMPDLVENTPIPPDSPGRGFSLETPELPEYEFPYSGDMGEIPQYDAEPPVEVGFDSPTEDGSFDPVEFAREFPYSGDAGEMPSFESPVEASEPTSLDFAQEFPLSGDEGELASLDVADDEPTDDDFEAVQTGQFEDGEGGVREPMGVGFDSPLEITEEEAGDVFGEGEPGSDLESIGEQFVATTEQIQENVTNVFQRMLDAQMELAATVEALDDARFTR